MIRYLTFLPSGNLRAHIRSYYYIEHSGDARESSVQRVLPDGCTEINFTLGAPILRKEKDGSHSLLGESYLTNRRTTHYFLQRTGYTRMMGVCFYPHGLRAFLKIPLSELPDTCFSPSGIFGKRMDRLQENLLHIASPEEGAKLLEFFFQRELNSGKQDPLVADAVRMIYRAEGNLDPYILFAQYGLSARRIEQRFREQIGMRPNLFIRLVRFQHAWKYISAQPESSLIVAAADCGYFDQSHFIRDFKFFAGLAPGKYLKENRALSKAMMNDLFTDYLR